MAESCNTCAAAESLSESLLTSESFIAHFRLFKRQTNIAMERRRYITILASKEQIDTLLKFKDGIN